MWIRKDLKSKAKEVLRQNYWKAFLISLVLGATSGTNWGSGSNVSDSSFDKAINTFGSLFLFILALIIIATILFALAFRIFLGYPLEVGGSKYFIQSAQYSDNKKCIRFAFYGYNYKGILLTMLYKGFLNSLWFLLLIIPGIVKSYAYSMVPYILADNPNIGYKRAVDLSKNMTYGHKGAMFVLDLSFIGWFLLGILACGLGVLFVMPYVNATKAELYLVLRQNALDNGICHHGEFLMNNSDNTKSIMP